MKKNVGPIERAVRLVLGGIAIAVVASQPHFGLSETIVGLAGVFLILNALTARCYLWRWLGIDTNQANCDLEQRSD